MKVNPRFFVVIHTVSSRLAGLEHALDQASVARDNVADGVFLIPDYAKGSDKQATVAEQFLYLNALKEAFPDFPIGVNFLQRLSDIGDQIYASQPSLLQTDSASTAGLDRSRMPSTELFCGVAFKYSRFETVSGGALREHCLKVAGLCNVPTTSGKATGVSADLEKVREIVGYLPKGKRLGIASGVSEQNIDSYLEAGVTDFLVATSLVLGIDGLSRDILDPGKVLRLAEKIRKS